MAYVSNDQTDDDEENQSGQQAASSGPVSPSGGGSAVHLAPSSGVGSSAGASGAPSANGTPSAGGSFATLDKYVGANQGQAQGLANNITSGIGQQYNSLNSANQSTLGNIQGEVNSGYTPENQSVLSAENTNPVSFASNPTNIASFQGQLNDQYTGPTSAESDAGYQSQQAAINNAISEGNASTQTDAGRQNLLESTEAAPTAGTTALNDAILSQDSNAQSQIENAYQPFNNLLTGLSSGAQGIDQNIAGAQTSAASANQAANAQIASQVGDLNSTVGGELTADQNAISGYNSAANTVQSAANTANTDIQGYLASTPQVTADTSGLTPYMNLQQLNDNATDANAASSQDYAYQNALQELEGATPLNTDITQSTSGQAGTALPSDFSSLLSQLSGLPTAVQNSVGGIGTEINNDYAPLGSVEAQREAMWGEQAALPAEQKTVAADQAALKTIPPTMATSTGNRNDTAANPAYTAAQAKLTADSSKLSSDTAKANNGGAALGQQAYNLAQGDQWIPGAATNYNSLLTTLNQGLAPIGNIDMSGIQAPSDGGGTIMPGTAQGEKEAGAIGTGIGTVAGGILGGVYGGPAGAAGGASIGGALGKPAGEGAYTSIAQLSSDISNPKLDTTGLDIATGGLSIGIEQGINAVADFFKGLF